MSIGNMKRSQAILRMPFDMVEVAVVLHDGERFDGLLFIPPTEDIARLVSEGPPFVAVVRGGLEHFIARTSIAAIGLPADRAPQLDAELSIQSQCATVKLRCGLKLDGELRWISPDGQKRTIDGLNAEGLYLVIYGSETTHLIMKEHVSTVLEV